MSGTKAGLSRCRVPAPRALWAVYVLWVGAILAVAGFGSGATAPIGLTMLLAFAGVLVLLGMTAAFFDRGEGLVVAIVTALTLVVLEAKLPDIAIAGASIRAGLMSDDCRAVLAHVASVAPDRTMTR